MKITLTRDECHLAAQAGIARRLEAMGSARVEVHGAASNGDYWTVDIEAAGAELAVAKAMGRFWTGTGGPDRETGDVGGLQVRHSRRFDARLILHDRDIDDHAFVLITGSMPTFEVVGHILARDGKAADYWWAQAPRPAYFVPVAALTPGLPS